MDLLQTEKQAETDFFRAKLKYPFTFSFSRLNEIQQLKRTFDKSKFQSALMYSVIHYLIPFLAVVKKKSFPVICFFHPEGRLRNGSSISRRRFKGEE